jgi:hypothetical protein
MVLISYENEVSPHSFQLTVYHNPNISSLLQAPPQLWRIDMINDGEGSKDARLAHVRTYRPKGKVNFAGPSYFGGTTKDNLVLVPTKYARPLPHLGTWSR